MNDLGWINHTLSDHAQSRQARYEEVFATSGFHKSRNLTQDVGRLIALRVHLQHRLARCFLIRIVIAQQDFFVATGLKIITVIDPLLLYEFKLAMKGFLKK